MFKPMLSSWRQNLSLSGRYGLLLFGLVVYGLSVRLMLNAQIGVAPWDVLHVGVTRHLPLSVGQVSISVGALLLLYTALVLRERLGPGTLFNVLIIGLVLDHSQAIIPEPQFWPWQWLQLTAGVLLTGLATGAYVGAGLGAGPRDGLMMGLHRRYGWPVLYIRTVIELLVLGLGIWLGGPLGWGTLAFALMIGWATHQGLELFGIRREPLKDSVPSKAAE